jgi:hypothetical protein
VLAKHLLNDLARLEVRLWLAIDGSSTSIEGGRTPPIGVRKAQLGVRRLPASLFLGFRLCRLHWGIAPVAS